MYFELESSRPDTPTVDGAMSRRESLLISLLAHVLILLAIWIVPTLPFVQEAVKRRAEDMARRQEQQLALERQQEQEERRIVFVEPLFDVLSPTPPEQGFLSDEDRVARAPERALEPENPLPFARGNSFAPVVAPELLEAPRGDGLASEPAEGEDVGEEESVAAASSEVNTDSAEASDQDERQRELDGSEDIGILEFPEGPNEVARAATRTPEVGETRVAPPLAGGSLGDAIRNIERFIDQETFNNPSGGEGEFGPSIQFNTYGVEFGPWIRRFIAQIKRNWMLPQAAMTFKGHSVLTFNVHKNGALTDVTVLEPSVYSSFNTSARNALLASNPTQPLPQEYPVNTAFFTVTFYYNEPIPGY
jgi:TonB family protein